MKPMVLADDHALAASVATEAGNLLVEMRERLFVQGAGSRTVGDVGDREAHRLIVERLSESPTRRRRAVRRGSR